MTIPASRTRMATTAMNRHTGMGTNTPASSRTFMIRFLPRCIATTTTITPSMRIRKAMPTTTAMRTCTMTHRQRTRCP